MYTHKDYMDKKCSHHEYFSQFITNELKWAVNSNIGIEVIKASTDKHFNDISLKRWDGLFDNSHHVSARGKNIHSTHGVAFMKKKIDDTGTSLSDLVCTAKAYAREVRGW